MLAGQGTSAFGQHKGTGTPATTKNPNRTNENHFQTLDSRKPGRVILRTGNRQVRQSCPSLCLELPGTAQGLGRMQESRRTAGRATARQPQKPAEGPSPLLQAPFSTQQG